MVGSLQKLKNLAILVLAGVFPAQAEAQAVPGDPAAAIAAATKLDLAQSRDWMLLLHDFPQSGLNPIGAGYHSMLDDPNFFLSPNGQSNSSAELEATIRGMYLPQNHDQSPAVIPDKEITENSNLPPQPGDDHPQCRFPARYAWLRSQLPPADFSPPQVACPSFDEWLKNIAPKKIILVFPAAYLNSPASMFGHTLLRIESNEHGSEDTILGYGASFAAFTGDDGGIAFAYKGLFGGYIGAYSVSPYYKEIRRYNDLEHRDIWEYSLNFNPGQVDRIVRHLWELEKNYFDYYFFDENCALHLLGLLDYGDPDLHLSEQLPLWVIPAEAVRVLVKANRPSGEPLVESVHFRPSRSTKIHALQAEMDDEEELSAKAIASSEQSPAFDTFTPERQAKILDLAIVYLEYLNTSRKVPVEETRKLEHQLLVKRSRLPSIDPPPIDRPETRPEAGHFPGRLTIGGGLRGDNGVLQYRIRPAHHENIDPQPGYVAGAQVSFFDLTLEQVEGAGLVLDAFVPLKIVSLSPRERFIKPWSWEVATGLVRLHGENTDPLVTFLSGGFGVSARPASSILLYALGEPSLQLQRDYKDDYRLALGPKTGAFIDLSDSLRLGFSAAGDLGLAGDTEGRYSFDSESRYALTPGDHPIASIRSVLRRYHELDSNTAEWKLLLDLYF